MEPKTLGFNNNKIICICEKKNYKPALVHTYQGILYDIYFFNVLCNHFFNCVFTTKSFFKYFLYHKMLGKNLKNKSDKIFFFTYLRYMTVLFFFVNSFFFTFVSI